MWDCLKCKCKAIAAGLSFCPQCFKPKEDEVPKVTTGGPSNAAAGPGEPGYAAPPAEPAPKTPVKAPEAPVVSPPAPPAPVDPPKAKPDAGTGSVPAPVSSAPLVDPDVLKDA